MGIKSVPLGYLEFLRAFGGKLCPHACALPPPAPSHSIPGLGLDVLTSRTWFF